MLRIFSKIRLALIGSSTRRYLFYALGEIALVVIGILIALQINNWNQGITEKKELHSYLATIKGNLESDIESLEEIKLFRDSSMAYSRRWLMLAKKESITPLDLLKQEESPYGVFVDNYFQPRNSGFEALKTSGLIGKLNGTILEEKLNNYYYLIDKIRESETSLNNTIETMENFAFDKNIIKRKFEIIEASRAGQELPKNINAEIKELLNHPDLYSANMRNVVENYFPGYYIQAGALAKSIVEEIEITLKD